MLPEKKMVCKSMSCRLGCGKSFPPKNEGLHRATDCGKYIFSCKFCEDPRPLYKLPEHYALECQKCTYTCPVCDKEGLPRKDVSKHIIYDCNKKENQQLCLYCNSKFYVSEIQDHIKSCPVQNETEATCEFCSATMKTGEIIMHMVYDCPNKRKPCPKCADLVPIAELGEHYIKACKEYKLKCVFCTKEIPLSEYPNHVFDNCSNFSFKCGRCNSPVMWASLMTHYFGNEPCPSLSLPCPLKCSLKTDILVSQFEEHLIGLSTAGCDKYEVTCSKKDFTSKDLNQCCGSKNPRCAMLHHLAHDCEFNTYECEHCLQQIKEKNRGEHTGKCGMEWISCDVCKDEMPREAMDEHKSNSCSKTTVDCPNVKYGCDVKMIASRVKVHMKACPRRKVKAHTKLSMKAPHAEVKEESHMVAWDHGGTTYVHRTTADDSIPIALTVVTAGIANLFNSRNYPCCGQAEGSQGCVSICDNCFQERNADKCLFKCSNCPAKGEKRDWENISGDLCKKLCRACFKDPDDPKYEYCELYTICEGCQNGKCVSGEPGCMSMRLHEVDPSVLHRKMFMNDDEDETPLKEP